MKLSSVRWMSFAAAAGAAGALGCSSPYINDFNSCSNPGAGTSLAMEVTVRDSASGKFISDSASGTMVTIGVSDSLGHYFPSDSSIYGIGGPGDYVVTVDRPGYHQWTDEVLVLGDVCGRPETAHFTARMEPAP